MNLLIALFAGLLFFVLSPNIFLRLPKNGNKFTVAGVHAVVFALVLFLFQSLIFRTFGLREGLPYDNEADCTSNGGNWDGTKCSEGFDDASCNTGDQDTGTHMFDSTGECVLRKM
jgi:hypothetical protein